MVRWTVTGPDAVTSAPLRGPVHENFGVGIKPVLGLGDAETAANVAYQGVLQELVAGIPGSKHDSFLRDFLRRPNESNAEESEINTAVGKASVHNKPSAEKINHAHRNRGSLLLKNPPNLLSSYLGFADVLHLNGRAIEIPKT